MIENTPANEIKPQIESQQEAALTEPPQQININAEYKPESSANDIMKESNLNEKDNEIQNQENPQNFSENLSIINIEKESEKNQQEKNDAEKNEIHQENNEEEIQDQENLENLEQIMSSKENSNQAKGKVIICNKLPLTPLSRFDTKVSSINNDNNNNDKNNNNINKEEQKPENKFLEITLKDPKEKESGLFSNNYIQYTVLTKPLNFHVYRRYNDFYLLRKLLVKYFPLTQIPPLPPKKMGSKRFTAKFIRKRMKFLTIFINNVAANETLKNSEILYIFLSQNKRETFEQKFKELAEKNFGLLVTDDLKNYTNLEGKITVNNNSAKGCNDKYYLNLKKYLAMQNTMMEKFNSFIKNFLKCLTGASINLKGGVSVLAAMEKINTKVQMKPSITQSYMEVGKFFLRWEKIFKSQIHTVKNYIKHFFKYQSWENNALIEVLEQRNDIKKLFEKEKTKILSKKEKLFANKNWENFELNQEDKIRFDANEEEKQKLFNDKEFAFKHLCFNETKRVERLGEIVSYGDGMVIRGLKDLIRGNCFKIHDYLKQFSDEFYPCINEFVGIWTDFEEYLRMVKVWNKSV